MQPAAKQLAVDVEVKKACGDLAKLSADTQVEALVEKAIVDSLKGWSEQFDVNRDSNGMTARERLRQRKAQWLTNPKKFPCGKRFYDELRKDFRATDSPQKKLANLAPKGGDIQEALLKGAMAYQKNGHRGGR